MNCCSRARSSSRSRITSSSGGRGTGDCVRLESGSEPAALGGRSGAVAEPGVAESGAAESGAAETGDADSSLGDADSSRDSFSWEDGEP